MRPDLAPRLMLVAFAAALLAAALFVAPARRPDDGRQSTLWLAVEQRAGTADAAAAFASRFGSPPRGVELDREGRLAPARPHRLGVATAALARRLAGWPGVFALQSLLVVAILVLLARAGRGALGSGAAIRWVLVGLAASAAPLAALSPTPELLGAFGVALAAATIWGRRAAPTIEPESIYGGELAERSGAWRWPAAGVAFGLAAISAPSLLPLAAPFVAAAPRGRRLLRGLGFAVGTAITGLAAAVLSGSFWQPVELWYDHRLLGWSGVALLAGRHLGVVTLFLPLAAGFAEPSREEGRRWIPWAVLAALALQLVTSPFDVAGDAGAAGNAWFLPVAALLVVLPRRLPGGGALAALALASIALVAPLALGALGLGERGWARGAAAVRAWLPLETTEREVLGAAVLDRASGIVVRGFPPAVFAAADGTLRITAPNAPLLLESGAELASVRFEFGASAPASIGVTGGRSGDLLARPSGELALDVDLGEPDRRHPTWRSPRGAAIYFVTVTMDKAPPAPVALDLSLARPRGGAGEVR